MFLLVCPELADILASISPAVYVSTTADVPMRILA